VAGISFVNRTFSNKGLNMSDAVAVPVQDNVVAGFNAAGEFYSSLPMRTPRERMELLKKITNATKVDDAIGTTIPLANIIVQSVDLTNDTTGEVETALRITLIDVDDNAFVATSKGIANQLKLLLQVMGDPQGWTEPVPVTFAQEGSGTRKYFTLKY
jgi:hypothetical protein